MTRRPASAGLAAVVAEMESAAAAKKCHRCGCFRDALTQLRASLPALPKEAGERLLPVLDRGSEQLLTTRYDCLGCEICWPANALNLALDAFPGARIDAAESCPVAPPAAAPGWPPYPGNYRVLDAGGDVALCTLTSEGLIERLASARPARVAIVGGVYTENLGLERMVWNITASPTLTTLVLCGADSRQRIGHRPGQSLLSLMLNGLDETGRIIGAEGRRPVLENVPREIVERFRAEIAVMDLIGEEDPHVILERVGTLAARPPRDAVLATRPDVIPAEPPDGLILDPLGYFVLFPDRARGVVVVEHYSTSGRLANTFEGSRSDHLYATILGRQLVSRLDHAAYLGQELARAVRALESGDPYVQDQAPEPGCGSACGCRSRAGAS